MAEQTRTLGEVVGALTRRIHDPAYPSGDRAALRRFRAEDAQAPAPLAFYRLAVDFLPEGWDRTEAQARAWRTLVQTIALMPGEEQRSLGEALAAARVSEARLERLLDAPPASATLCAIWLRLARMLAAKREGFRFRDLAELLLTEEAGKAEAVRKRIASDYYRAARQQQAA